MAELIRRLLSCYKYICEDLIDKRSEKYPLVGKPYLIFGICGLYLMFVLKWGPKWMKNRQPFNIDRLLLLYNAVQVISCFYVFVCALKIWSRYKLFCEPVYNEFETEHGLFTVRTVYSYFILKLVDLFDTVFFVLRKKNDQITFLHVYHHCGMTLLTWGAVTYLPGGHGTSVGVINSFVHVIMYSYYFLTVWNPEFKNYIWMKKLITQMQIIQFFLTIVHIGSLLIFKDCSYPRWIVFLFIPQNLFMLILFTDFYIKSYIKNKDKVKHNSLYSDIQNHKINKKNTHMLVNGELKESDLKRK